MSQQDEIQRLISEARKQELEADLPQQSTFEQLENFEVELEELIKNDGGSGEPWDDLLRRVSHYYGE